MLRRRQRWFMPTEIERKFLVINDSWREGPSGVLMRQGYLATGGGVGATVRVRVIGSGATARGRITIKGPARRAAAGPGHAVVRDEFEYDIPGADAEHMLRTLCAGRVVEKVRSERVYGGLVWEVDEFSGANAGLVLAEVELERADQRVDRPPWVGREVTDDPRYANSSLALRPITDARRE